MNALIDTSSYLGLFLISIFSFTIFPGPSDAVILGLVALGFPMILVVLVATAGGMIGRVINYHMGLLGEDYVVQKKKWLKTKQVERSKKLFEKYGTWVLLFTWVPFIDDPLTVVAGFFKFPFWQYFCYTLIAALVRHVGLVILYQYICVNSPGFFLCGG